MPPKKRKLEEELSTNANTVKARKRVQGMDAGRKAVHNAKEALRKATQRAKAKCHQTHEYKISTPNDQEKMLKHVEEEVANKL